jgi:low affinity Fe/Cu permease
LRYSLEAQRELVVSTFGRADVFTEGTVAQVLERARAKMRAEAEEELRRTRSEHDREIGKIAAERRAEREAANERLEAQRRSCEAAEHRAHEFADAAKRERERREVAAHETARSVGRAISGVVMVFGCIVVAVGVWAASGPLLPDTWRHQLPPLFLVAVAVVVLLSVPNILFGTTLKDFASRLDRRITCRLKRWLLAKGQTTR